MDLSIKESKRSMNCPLLLKRRQALTHKQQAVKKTQEQLQAHGQSIEPMLITKLLEVSSKLTRLHLIDNNDLDV